MKGKQRKATRETELTFRAPVTERWDVAGKDVEDVLDDKGRLALPYSVNGSVNTRFSYLSHSPELPHTQPPASSW